MLKKTCLALFISILLIFPTLMGCTADTTPTPDISTPTPAPTEASPAPTTMANWWDKFGEPQYGGTLTIRYSGLPVVWDTNQVFPSCFLWEPLFDSSSGVSHQESVSPLD